MASALHKNMLKTSPSEMNLETTNNVDPRNNSENLPVLDIEKENRLSRIILL
jgi:hypothetical protein